MANRVLTTGEVQKNGLVTANFNATRAGDYEVNTSSSASGTTFRLPTLPVAAAPGSRVTIVPVSVTLAKPVTVTVPVGGILNGAVNGTVVWSTTTDTIEAICVATNSWTVRTNPVVLTVADGFVNLNNQVFSSSSFVDSTNGIYAIPSAGKWRLRYDLATDSTGDNNANPHFVITDSLNNIINGSSRSRGGNTSTLAISAEVTVTTTGPATYKLRGQNGGGGTSTIYNSTDHDSTISWLQIGAAATTQFVGSTASVVGLGGFVPAPPINPTPGSKVLTDDGNWSSLPNPITQTFVGSGTYTPTAGMKYVEIEMCGAGGGSGGAQLAGAANWSASGSGGGGAYLKFRATAAQIGASRTITIGAGGSGGAPGGAGSNGGTTAVAGMASCPGGTAGAVGAVATGTTGNIALSAGGSPTFTLGSLIVSLDGQSSGRGIGTSTFAVLGSSGANPLGIKVNGSSSTTSFTAIAITSSTNGYGTGALGSLTINGAARGGSIGTQGVVIITEYF
jgi:hypothetical protein